ncbi:MAG: trehalose-phosphatase [Acidiferrobacterales bacterium]
MDLTLPQYDGFEGFFQTLRAAGDSVLMLDYDGTLAPFQIDPCMALPYPGVCELIDRIIEQDRTRVVLVTGRWIKDLMPLLGLGRTPEIWGSHGWEQLQPDGEYRTATIGAAALRSLVSADDWTGRVEAAGGRCEHKPAGLAIHWRGLEPDQIANVRAIVLEQWRYLRLDEHLHWHDFDGGIELRAPGRTKAYALQAVLAGMSPQTAIAYLGDDETDEDAFRAIEGHGIGVLVRPQPRPSNARHWLQPPHALLEFLQQWHRARGME